MLVFLWNVFFSRMDMVKCLFIGMNMFKYHYFCINVLIYFIFSLNKKNILPIYNQWQFIDNDNLFKFRTSTGNCFYIFFIITFFSYHFFSTVIILSPRLRINIIKINYAIVHNA